ncbi:rhamnogalacturonan acetylesterase [Verticillium alfalfae VaMs.102]|uniref:Rhamnogalacturonan acetylesterase n=1 Tax=Verticillium alfalfae (strain VaMs.102 / ATCC MYA-4576 / FGSC 10136) TaxID=526221 RepID=C9SBM5_VERA1|nr:rhamnogalacturonan acetylesterase [Verticillium alfalfae VaMs.102]EEY15759.1 rhamnogalacturonan acetylesterase [Verticillium alfalfae VaMs.102]
MRTNFLLAAAACLGLTSALPTEDVAALEERQTRVPTIFLCGDSTVATVGASSQTQGWGAFLQYSFQTSKAVVDNRAIGGRSARSYTREGRFDTVANLAQSGDWVVIELGHNDGGSLSTDNGRSACFGDGEQTCSTVYKLAAQQLGGPAKGVYFLPHGEYGAQAQRNLGASTVNGGYPVDHLHPGPFIADAMAKSFVLALRCGSTALGGLVRNSTSSLTSTYLGPCIGAANSTISALLR